MEIIILFIILSVVMNKKKKDKTVKPNEPRKRDKSETDYAFSNNMTKQIPKQPKPEPTRKDLSTMEMLNQKAEEDQREHQMEERQRKVHDAKHYGARNYATRFYPGDAISQGQKVVNCEYCNAENLIPSHAHKKNYHCYFCREEL